MEMETAYRSTLPKRILNRIMRLWIHLGLPPGKYHLLTVIGRKSGRPYSTPVSVMKVQGRRWLVSPYRSKDWVKNARAAGQVTLSRRGRFQVVTIEEELDPAQSAPVLKVYLNEEPITRRFFHAKSGSVLEAFAEEAHLHPVFRILQQHEEIGAP